MPAHSNSLPAVARAPRPAVPIKKSVTDDYIFCLEDGLPFKFLRSHLRSTYGLTPDQYRRKWGLAPDYPMTAPSYSRERQDAARKSGFWMKSKSAGNGRQRRTRATKKEGSPCPP